MFINQFVEFITNFEKAISIFPCVLARIDPQSTCANSGLKSSSENLEKSRIIVFLRKSVSQENSVKQN